MATEHRIQLTGPELDERLAQVLTNEEDIWQEQQTRETTDEGMQEQIGALSTRMDAQDTTNEQVATDIENLQKAIGTGGSVDDKIAAAVGAEASAREAADTALGGRITTLETAVGTGGSVDERIATEAAARANADTALGNRMTTLEGGVDDRLDQQDAAIGLLDGHKLEVVDALPTEQEPAVTPESDVIYRLVVTDSETGDVSYEDYMYNEDDLTTPRKIANYPLPGVDEEPTAGSKKLVESGGVVELVSSTFLPKKISNTSDVDNGALRRFNITPDSSHEIIKAASSLGIKYFVAERTGDYLVVFHDVVEEPIHNTKIYSYKIGIFADEPTLNSVPITYIGDNGDTMKMGKVTITKVHVEQGQYLAATYYTSHQEKVSFFSNANGFLEVIDELNNSNNPVTSKAVKEAIDALIEQDNTILESIQDLELKLEIYEEENLNYEKIEQIRVNRDNYSFEKAGTPLFKIAYVLIPQDTLFDKIRVSDVDNYNHSRLQAIGISSDVPNIGDTYDAELNFHKFSDTKESYSEVIPLTDDIKGKYLFVTIFDHPAKGNPTSLSIVGLKASGVDIKSIISDIDNIEERVAELESTPSAIATKIFNPPINFSKQELRILDIGNSFTNGAISYLYELISSAGIDISSIAHCVAYRGGASFKNWYDCYHDSDTSTYTVTKTFGGLPVDLTGIHDIGNGEQFRNVLTNNRFDIILIHQSSAYSGEYKDWEGDGDGGYLKELVRLIRTKQPQASIGYLMTHSNPSTDADIDGYYNKIAESVKKISANYGINFIIPYGTAIQNIRKSAQNTSTHYLTKDGKHIADGLAKYVAACTYFQSLISPRYGISVYGNSYIHKVTSSEKSDVTEDYLGDLIDVTNENKDVAQMAAILACNDMYTINNPDGVSL